MAEAAARAYENTGVWATPVAVGSDVTSAMEEHARNAALLVLGVSDRWVRDQHSLGELRDVVAARAAAPVLIVRKHGQPGARGPSRWFRRQREWMDESSGELDIEEVARIEAAVAGSGTADVSSDRRERSPRERA